MSSAFYSCSWPSANLTLANSPFCRHHYSSLSPRRINIHHHLTNKCVRRSGWRGEKWGIIWHESRLLFPASCVPSWTPCSLELCALFCLEPLITGTPATAACEKWTEAFTCWEKLWSAWWIYYREEKLRWKKKKSCFVTQTWRGTWGTRDISNWCSTPSLLLRFLSLLPLFHFGLELWHAGYC